MVAAAAIAAGASVAGSAISASAATSASKLQGDAANRAMIAEGMARQDNQTNQSAFVNNGQASSYMLRGLLGVGDPGQPSTMDSLRADAPLTMGYAGSAGALVPVGEAPAAFSWAPTMGQLEQTPGYQFSLDQGLKAAQNGYAARGLATSGASAKGAIDYATGLAGTTYQQNYNNALTTNQAQQQQYQNRFSNYLSAAAQFYGKQQQTTQQLSGAASLGENAAANTGNTNAGITAAQSQLGTAGAAASAAGAVGTANSINSGLGGLAGAYQQYSISQLLQQNGALGGLAGTNPAGGIYGTSGGGIPVPQNMSGSIVPGSGGY